MKLTKKYLNVLGTLSTAEAWTSPSRLPDGNGRANCASGFTLRDLMKAGLIEYGREPQHSFSGYRITDAGRVALARSLSEEKAP